MSEPSSVGGQMRDCLRASGDFQVTSKTKQENSLYKVIFLNSKGGRTKRILCESSEEKVIASD